MTEAHIVHHLNFILDFIFILVKPIICEFMYVIYMYMEVVT